MKIKWIGIITPGRSQRQMKKRNNPAKQTFPPFPDLAWLAGTGGQDFPLPSSICTTTDQTTVSRSLIAQGLGCEWACRAGLCRGFFVPRSSFRFIFVQEYNTLWELKRRFLSPLPPSTVPFCLSREKAAIASSSALLCSCLVLSFSFA